MIFSISYLKILTLIITPSYIQQINEIIFIENFIFLYFFIEKKFFFIIAI
jgi:hypothetical protein